MPHLILSSFMSFRNLSKRISEFEKFMCSWIPVTALQGQSLQVDQKTKQPAAACPMVKILAMWIVIDFGIRCGDACIFSIIDIQTSSFFSLIFLSIWKYSVPMFMIQKSRSHNHPLKSCAWEVWCASCRLFFPDSILERCRTNARKSHEDLFSLWPSGSQCQHMSFARGKSPPNNASPALCFTETRHQQSKTWHCACCGTCAQELLKESCSRCALTSC